MIGLTQSRLENCSFQNIIVGRTLTLSDCVDMHDPWIVLRNLWIPNSCRNPCPDRTEICESRSRSVVACAIYRLQYVIGELFSKYQCWAQSVDRRYPWICLSNLWIHTLCRNPWIAQISVDRATRSMNFAYI